MARAMRPRWAKIWRDLWLNKTRTALVVLSIAIGAFASGTILSSRQLVDTQLNGGYLASSPSQATLYTEPVPDEVLAMVRGMKGVAEAEGRRQITVKVWQGSNWRSLRLAALADYTHMRLDKLTPESGIWPPARGQLLLERASADKPGGLGAIALGGQVQIRLDDGRVRSLRMAGTVHNPSDVAPVFNGSLSGFVTRDTLARFGEPLRFDQIHLMFTGRALSKEDIRAAAQEVRSKLQRSGIHVGGVDVPDPGRHPAAQVNDSIMTILGALGVLCLLLSGFLVVNTVTALLTQQTKQIGIMKSVGATTAQVAGVYFSMVVVLGMLSLAMAVPAGMLATRAFTNWVGSMMNFDPAPRSFVPLGLAVEIAVGLLVPLIAAAGPILSATRASVREALSYTGISGGNRAAAPRTRSHRRLAWLPRPMNLALRNTFRRKGRLGLTLLTLCLGGAVFSGVLSVRQSLYHTMDDAFRYWNYDAAVNLNRNYATQRVVAEALTVPGVVAAECWNYKSSQVISAKGVPGDTYQTIGLPPSTRFLRPIVTAGRWLVDGDDTGVVVNTNVTKREPGLGVGDKVRLRAGTRETVFTVVGIVRGVMTGPVMYVNQGWFAPYIGEAGRASSVNILSGSHDSASEAKVADAVQSHFGAVGLEVGSRDDLMADVRHNIGQQFDILVVILLAMALLVAAVGGLGLAGTMGMNVLDRTKEIGVMRAIGARDRSVVGVFVLEGMTIGLIGWVVGVLASVPIGKLLSDSVGTQFMGAPLSYSFSLTGAAAWLALSALLSAAASIAPAWKASRLTVRDVLSYEG